MAVALVLSVLFSIGLGLEIAFQLGRRQTDATTQDARVFLCGGSIGSTVAILMAYAIGLHGGFWGFVLMIGGFFVGGLAGGLAFNHFTGPFDLDRPR